VRVWLVAAVAAACLGGCGGGDAKKTGLDWDGKPQVFSLKDLPSDRVLIGQVVNRGPGTLHLSSARLAVVDASGKRLKSSGAYTATFGHGLFGAFQQPSEVPQAEASRLGRDVYLIKGQKSPFFSAWRIPAGSHGPFKIQWGGGALEAPAEVKPAR
jgi:hypothetical protein